MRSAFRFTAATMMVGVIIGLVPGIASASIPEAKLSTHTADDVLWIKTSVTSSVDEDLKVKVFAPRKSGNGRHLFQVCEFTYSGAGDYLCGIDVSEGSMASEHEGLWVGKALIDHEVASKQRFSI